VLWDLEFRPPVVLRVLVAVGAPAGCTVIDDPNHCANRQGDATCDVEFPGRVCSSCQRASSGCAETPVEAACRPSAEGEPTEPTTVTTVTTSTGTSGSTGETGTQESSTTTPVPPECEGEGEVDSCPDDRPYCVDGACTGCEAAGGHGFCEALDGATPQCNADWGRCVVCVDDDSPFCVFEDFCTTEFTCGGCTRQAQCPDSACNVWTGACMDDAMKLWVQPANSGCNDSNAGSEPAPLCTAVEALSRLPNGGEGILYLGNGRHLGVDFFAANAEIALIGDGANVFTESNTAQGEVGASFGGTTEIMIHNMRLTGTDAPALACTDGAKVALESVAVVGGAPHAIDVATCDLLLQRSRVTNQQFTNAGAQGTLRFSGGPTSTLRLYSSTLALQATDETAYPTVRVDGGVLDVRGSTIIALEPGAKILGCDLNISGAVHSALLSASPTAAGIECPGATFDYSVIDSTRLDGQGLVRLPFTFSGWFRSIISDLRLREDGAAVEELEGIGRWELGDPLLDYDGAPLPTVPGTPIYPGGDQR